MSKSRWQPLIAYNDQGKSWLIEARRRESGHIQFRSTRIGPIGGLCYEFPRLDMHARFEAILKGDKP